MMSESGTSSDSSPAVVVLCSDLMLTSQIDGAARQAGVSLGDASDVAALISAVGPQTKLIVVDLDTPGLDCTQLTVRQTESRPRLLGVYPHVRKDLLAAAEAAGFDEVVSRGSFVSQLPELMQSVSSRN